MTHPHLPHTWIDNRLQARASAIHGVGVFTHAPVAEGEVLMIFGGEVVQVADLDPERFCLKTAFPIDDGLFLAMTIEVGVNSLDRWLNHCCEPTAWLTDAVTVVARRNLDIGDEITLDAATWDADESWPFSDDGRCRCAVHNCRQQISARDWQNAELQRKYQGHFSPYIQRKIEEVAARTMAG